MTSLTRLPEDWLKSPRKLDQLNAHQQWVTLSVTKSFLGLLEKELDKMEEDLLSAVDNKDVPDNIIRTKLAKIKAFKKAQKLAYDTQAFVDIV